MKKFHIPFSWEERRPVILERALYIPPSVPYDAWQPIPWPSLFGDDHPVHIEFCSGNGQWIVEQARRHPHANWVAVEKRFDRARKIWKRSEHLSNLFVIMGDARAFARFFAPAGGAHRLYINFPDPWPKRRHAKHRLIDPDFASLLTRITAPGAFLLCVTDDAPYRDHMLTALASWRPHHYATEWPDYGDSFFADLWRSKGRTLYYLSWSRP